MTDRIDLESLRVSVVIPTYNRGEQLRRCLHALARDFPGDAEVIVVSDGGDTAAFPDLSCFQESLRLTVVHAEHGGPAHARNQGLERVRAPVVAFTDDDCLPRPGWLENLTRRVSADPPTAAGGLTLNGLPHNPWAVTAQLILDMGERDSLQRNYGPVFYASNNIAFPTDALRKLGGFDPEFRTSEDRELCRRWLRAGFRLTKASDAELEHAPQLNLARFWRRYIAYGSGAADFHHKGRERWSMNSLGFHYRVPRLAAAEMAEKKIRCRTRVYGLLVLWEFANLLGFIRAKRPRPASGRSVGPGSGR